MNLFKRDKTTKTTNRIAIPKNHVSKKKKNTYTVTFNALCQMELFNLCAETPLPVISINGTPMNTNSGWMETKKFPNPCASDMTRNNKFLSEIMGQKISCQIIEYLDKETSQPVLQLYPKALYVFDGYEGNYESHLNHASRQDLKKQIALREKLIDEYISRQNQK
ncbi:MAG: hypothetical protein R8N50_03865 [Alphaproteobacteria bacterium]|nr:hypothetical protein [Alphaproteobacteria bacterium]